MGAHSMINCMTKPSHPLMRLQRKLTSTPEVAATIGPVVVREIKRPPGRGLAALLTPPKARDKFVPVKLPPKFLSGQPPKPPFRPAPLDPHRSKAAPEDGR